MYFDWDEANIKHIARHGVLPHEFEEAMAEPVFLYEEEDDVDFSREHYVGMTRQGRILYLLITMRGERMRPITSFDAPKGMKRDFLAGQLM